MIAAFLILVAANGAVRVWKYFSMREARQAYERLVEEAAWVEGEVSELEKKLKALESQLEDGKRRITGLERVIRISSGEKRLEAEARRTLAVERYRMLAGDYQWLFSEYEKAFQRLRDLRRSIEELADRLDLQEQPR